MLCKIQKNWCTVTVAPTIEYHGGHSRTPANQRWDQVPGGVSVSCLASRIKRAFLKYQCSRHENIPAWNFKPNEPVIWNLKVAFRFYIKFFYWPCLVKTIDTGIQISQATNKFWKFFRSYSEFLSKFCAISFQEYFKRMSHPVFYGDLVHKLRRVKGASDFISSGSKNSF